MSRNPIKLAFQDAPGSDDWGLGDIDYAVKGDLGKSHEHMELRQPAFFGWVWKCYDERFEKRPDYQLWRALYRSRCPSALTRTEEDVFALAQKGLKDKNLVAWGTLVVLSGLLLGEESSVLSKRETKQIINLAEYRLRKALAVIDGCTAECAAIRLLSLDAIYKLRTAGGLAPMTVKEASEYLDKLGENLEYIDPRWALSQRRPVRTDFLAAERERKPILMPFPLMKVARRLGNPIFAARAFCRSAVCELNCLDEAAARLLKRAVSFAMLAWQQARSLRCDLQKDRSRDLPRVYREEIMALLRASQAARDIGDHLLNGRLAALFAWQASDAVAEDGPHGKASGAEDEMEPGGRETTADIRSRIREAMNNVCGTLRELGLQLPPEIVDRGQERDKRTEDRLHEEAGTGPDPYALRVKQEQDDDSRWKVLIENGYSQKAGSPHAPLEKLNNAIRKGVRIDLPVLHAGFSLCFDHRQFRTASNVLKALAQKGEHSWDELFRFAQCMKRATRLLPVLTWEERHVWWQAILRKAWAPLYDGELVSKTFTIHEVLVGSGLAVARSAKKFEIARSLAQKRYEQLAEHEIREVLDESEVVQGMELATVTLEHIQRWLDDIPCRGLGRPVCASAVRLDEQRFSLLTVGSGREPICQARAFPGLLEEARRLAEEPYLKARAENETPIPWQYFPQTMALASCLHDCARELTPGYRWLMLAVEPELACLPWQEIARQLSGDIVISLVPNLSWAKTAYPIGGAEQHCDVAAGIHLQVCDDSDQDIATFREQLQRQQEKLQHYFGSVAVVLGHGTLISGDNGALPVVESQTGALELVTDWDEVAGHRLCFLHSCYTGTVARTFLGDLGGIPGVVLNFGTRLVCAPVSEVSVNTAQKLHEYLTDTEEPGELGLRYLAATREDPRVALYNLYGFADEPACPHPPARDAEIGGPHP